MSYDFRKLALLAARAASDKKAVDPIILDLSSASDVADYMVIAGAESSTQLRAVFDHVETVLDEKGLRLLHRDGHAGGRWIALDYGALVVHILLSEAREFYRLEALWEDAKRIPFVDKAPKKRTRAKSKKD